jgi:C-terminal processing protease CtpA/Prc
VELIFKNKRRQSSKKLLTFFFCLIFLQFNAVAQWNIYTNSREVTSLYDVTEAFKANEFIKGYTFFGPNQSLKEDVKLKGIAPFRIKAVKGFPFCSERKALLWDVEFKSPLFLVYHKTSFYLNTFIQNVSQFEIFIKDANNLWYRKELKVEHEGYQLPSEVMLSEFSPMTTEALKPTPKTKKIEIKRLLIILKKEKENKPFKFVIGEGEFRKSEFRKVPAKGYFFYELTQDTQNQQTNYTYTSFGSSYPIQTFTIFRNLTSNTFWFTPEEQIDTVSLQKEIFKLLDKVIKKYPYYQERQIKKEEILKHIKAISESDSSFEEKLNNYNQLIQSFSDGHFTIEMPSTRLVPGSVFVKEISGEIQVAAVFDEEVKKAVSLGAKIIKVDGKPVEEYLSSLNFRLYGNALDQRHQAVAKILYKKPSDSTILTFIDQEQEKTVKYFYSQSLHIPQNFRPIHADFRKYKDWAYFRLNRWESGDWIRFYNHRETLRQSKGIIFDLRGNSGGLEVEAFKILSSFIEKPIVASHNTYMFNDIQGVHGSNVVVPNQYLDLSDLQVVILVDNSTACASEIFAKGLKDKGNTTIIGSERTSGSYASGDYFYLPFNLTLRTNVLNKFQAPTGSTPIENHGISPDIYVPIYHYRDLFPYDDKVLKTALDYISVPSNNY